MTEKITLADGSVYEVPDGFRQMDPQEQDAILRELIKQPPVSQEPSDDETDDEAPTGRGRELAEREAVDYYTAQGIVPSEEQIDEYLQAGPAGTPNGSMEDLMATEEARAAGEPMPFDTEQAATTSYLDAYNKQREVAGQEYLDKLNISPAQSALWGVGEGVGFNFLDEITAAGMAAIPSKNRADMWDEGQDFGPLYDKYVTRAREVLSASQERNTKSHIGGMIGGALLVPGGAGRQAAATAVRAGNISKGAMNYAHLADTARRIAPAAAAQGAVSGFGRGEGLEGRLTSAATDAAIGAVIGTGASAALSKLPGSKIAKFMQKNKDRPDAAYEAEAVGDLAELAKQGGVAGQSRKSLDADEINATAANYTGRYKERISRVAPEEGFDAAQITNLKNELDGFAGTNRENFDQFAGTVTGDAAREGNRMRQALHSLTPSIPRNPVAGVIGDALEWTPAPAKVTKAFKQLTGGTKTRENATRRLLKDAPNYARLAQELGPSPYKAADKAFKDLDAAVVNRAAEEKAAKVATRAAPKMSVDDVMIEQNILDGIKGDGRALRYLADEAGIPPDAYSKVVKQLADDPATSPEVMREARRLVMGYKTQGRGTGRHITARVRHRLTEDGILPRAVEGTAAATPPKGALSGYLSGEKALPKPEALDPINSGLGSPAYRDPKTGKSFRTDPETGDTIEVNPGAMVEPAPVLKAPATLARPSTEAIQLPLTTAVPKSMGSPAASQSRLAAAMGDMPAPSKVTDGVDTTLYDFAKANGMTDDAARNRIAMDNAYQAHARNAAKANRGEVVRSYNAAPKGEPERMVDVYSDGHHWQRDGDGLMNEGFVNDKFVPLSRDAQFPPRSAEEATVPMRPIDRPDNWEAGKNRWQEKANKRVDQFNTDIRFSDEARAAVQDAPEQIRDTYRTTEEAMDYVDKDIMPAIYANEDIGIGEASDIRAALHTIAKEKPYRTKAEFEAGTSGTGRKRSRGRPRAPQD